MKERVGDGKRICASMYWTTRARQHVARVRLRQLIVVVVGRKRFSVSQATSSSVAAAARSNSPLDLAGLLGTCTSLSYTTISRFPQVAETGRYPASVQSQRSFLMIDSVLAFG